MHTSIRKLTTLFAWATLFACAGSENQAETTANTMPAADTSAAETETPDAKASCVEIFVRQRECTDEFIPALVDARIRLDLPAGVAERASQEGRDAIIAEALAEWANDSKDPAIDGTCEQIVTSVPAETLDTMLAASSDCLAQSECTAFAACIVPVIELHLK